MVRRFEFAHPGEVERLGNNFPLWNGAPSLTYPIIIREELSTSMAGFASARWGLVPGWARGGGRRPPPRNAPVATNARNGGLPQGEKYPRGRVAVPADLELEKL
ncbi:SOS response-associated peptidase, partial [Mesorhizobium australicum]